MPSVFRPSLKFTSHSKLLSSNHFSCTRTGAVVRIDFKIVAPVYPVATGALKRAPRFHIEAIVSGERIPKDTVGGHLYFAIFTGSKPASEPVM